MLFKRGEAAQKLDVNPNIKLVIFQQFFCEGIPVKRKKNEIHQIIVQIPPV